MSTAVELSVRQLAEQLQIIRDRIRKPITITSGHRSAAHNKAVGGAPRSFHLYGMAADIKAQGVPAVELYHIIRRLMEEKKIIAGGLILYPTWVHYDTRGKQILL